MDITEKIKIKALETGFDLVGITTAEPINNEHKKFFEEWLADGFAGQMHYMHRNLDKRTEPAKLLEDSESVIVTGLNYTPYRQNSGQTNEPTGKVANYAQYEDYHQFIKKLLQKLIHYIDSLTESRGRFKICVDSVPLAERALAARAGLGFIGKNHMLTNPRLGNQILLGEIITTLKLRPDKPIKENCSDCNKCTKACPTQA
ncbi:MAG: epoxyqueuosine reductase, partial [Planctomycetota bacterium]